MPEQVRIMIKLKNTTNFVRRLMNRPNPLGKNGGLRRGTEGLFTEILSSIQVVGLIFEVLGNFDLKELGGFQVEAHFDTVRMQRPHGQREVAVDNLAGEVAGLASDIAVVDGEAQKSAASRKLTGESDDWHAFFQGGV